ncbi:hypothetical protein F5B18DRAFT_295419 [Nemania serpens]|nr:hypothetical protein F5B18DRAFT_295419 [Nemania serpens]
MVSSLKLSISCHCGITKQIVYLCDRLSSTPQDIDLCHCSACRHSTGLLCVYYASIVRPDSIEGLVGYRSTTESITRFFCATCGCHVFRRLQSPGEDDSSPEVGDDALAAGGQVASWSVATGVIIGINAGNGEESSEEGNEILLRYAKHINTVGTKYGGLSSWIRHINGQELEVVESQGATPPSTRAPAREKVGDSCPDAEQETFSGDDTKNKETLEVLNALCHCKMVQFHITRPNAASKLPRSNFPDLMVPYHTGSAHIQNPEDNKWWLRPGLGLKSRDDEVLPVEKSEPRRYLAGTCACRSCRLISGFEIQTWAFVPRANIFFHIRDKNGGSTVSGSQTLRTLSEAGDKTEITPLDFGNLPPDILTSYESSPGVRREFCSRCGATVFWRDRWRPELMDVSVGLLDADEGARAETWLDWWTERVSFAEDAQRDRTGETARLAERLISSLEEGLRRWS